MKKSRVFICEDDLAIADVLELGLDGEGFEVMVETNSVFAFGKLLDFSPDVIIVDLQMPIVTGDMLIETIRDERKLKKSFILCITANDKGREIALDAGANMVLPKPFQLDQIISIIHSVASSKN